MIPEFRMDEQMIALLMENGPGNMDVKAFIMQKDNDYPPRIVVAYQVNGYDGEEIDSGLEEPTEGHVMLPDEVDLAEGWTPVILTVDFLRKLGGTEPSASFFHPGVWYEAALDDAPSRTIRKSFHLKGFSREEEAEIYQHITSKGAY